MMFGAALSATADEKSGWETSLNEWLLHEDLEEDVWQDAYESLAALAADPPDINKVTREDLKRLPFLSERQVEDICAYVWQYGPVRSMAELALIESIDYGRRQLLSYFLKVGREEEKKRFPTWENLRKYGKHDLSLTLQVPLYKRKGDDGDYLGYPYRHTLRYKFHYSDFIEAGLTGAQDAGEPFLSVHNRWGYDHYSPYLVVRNWGKWKCIALGNYRLRFGSGLVINQSFGIGKTSVFSVWNSRRHISAHSSRSEGDYMQGAAATYAFSPHWEGTVFASLHHWDATLNKDSATVATLLKTGYHRTLTEIAKKNNTAEYAGGGHVAWKSGGFQVGLTGIYSAFDRLLLPDRQKTYKYYAPEGKSFWNLGVDYSYRSGRFSLIGETATGGCGALATLHQAVWSPSDNLSVSLVQRFYSKKYYALHARSFAEGGQVQNESGVYVGADWHPWSKVSMQAYVDVAYFPWERYRKAAGTTTWDCLFKTAYTGKRWSVSGRYRYKANTHRASLSAEYGTDKWHFRCQTDGTAVGGEDGSRGLMVSGNGGYKGQGWQVFASVAWFRTDDYDSRLYLYEKGPLYSFQFLTAYGHGMRYQLFARWNISSRLFLIGSIGTTTWFDRETISSGLQEINGKSKTDVSLQVWWKF